MKFPVVEIGRASLRMRSALSLGILLSTCLWAEAPLLAVDELSAQGVSVSDATIIADRLRSELLRTGDVRVLDRSEMDRILKEQAFRQNGACDQRECAVEIGKRLAVDRMVVGTVGKIGGLYTLGVRLVDVRTGEVLFTAIEDNEGRLEGVMAQAVPRVAGKLAKGASAASGAGATGLGTGDPHATRQDPDAPLTPDGRAVEGRSAWPWIAGCAVVAGGVTAAVLLIQDNPSKPSSPSTPSSDGGADSHSLTFTFDTGK